MNIKERYAVTRILEARLSAATDADVRARLAVVVDARRAKGLAAPERVCCPDCGGEGKVDGLDRMVRCGMCRGKGEIGPRAWAALSGR